MIEDGVATNYTSNCINGYTAISGGINFTPQYDDNGNLMNDAKHNYRYNLNNKLVDVDANLASYAYDVLGRRISKTTPAGTVTYFYVGNQMVQEYNGNNLVVNYVYGNNIDEALQMKLGNDTYYYHTNQLASTMALTDKSGNIAERVAYDAYGKPTFFNSSSSEISQSVVGNHILFTGREYDSETQTYYFRARTQNAQLGRFIQKDPLLFYDGMNDYAYVKNSPVHSTDPIGLIGINSTNGCGDFNNYFCSQHPEFTWCKNQCQQNPNLPWCKNRPPRKPKNPENLFNPIMGDNGLKNNPPEGWSVNASKPYKDSNPMQDWVNGSHPYWDNAKDWIHQHPDLIAQGVALGLLLKYGSKIAAAIGTAFQPEFAPITVPYIMMP